jgi:hypothetical protein
MKIRVSEAAFACHAKACAPPPVGVGGSRPSGGSRRAQWNAERAAGKAEDKARDRYRDSLHPSDPGYSPASSGRKGGIGGGGGGRKSTGKSAPMAAPKKSAVNPTLAKKFDQLEQQAALVGPGERRRAIQAEMKKIREQTGGERPLHREPQFKGIRIAN